MSNRNLLAALLLISSGAHATSIALSGTVGYRNWSDNSVVLTAGRIDNQESGGRSGTLYLELWACRAPTFPTSCFNIAAYRLGELNGRQYFYDVSSGTISASRPPPGTYYMIVAVTEYPARDTAVASTALDGTVTIGGSAGGGAGGGGSAPGSATTLDMSGAIGWNTSGRSVNIRVGRVANTSDGYTTGSLRLRLWATRQSYRGGRIGGYVLGERRLDPLGPGYYYTNIRGFVNFKRPPRGRYFTTVTLEEYDYDGTWRIRDYKTFAGRRQF